MMERFYPLKAINIPANTDVDVSTWRAFRVAEGAGTTILYSFSTGDTTIAPYLQGTVEGHFVTIVTPNPAFNQADLIDAVPIGCPASGDTIPANTIVVAKFSDKLQLNNPATDPGTTVFFPVIQNVSQSNMWQPGDPIRVGLASGWVTRVDPAGNNLFTTFTPDLPAGTSVPLYAGDPAPVMEKVVYGVLDIMRYVKFDKEVILEIEMK